MNYCEQCKSLSDGARGPRCKSKKLRAPLAEDFCLFKECDEATALLLKDVLAQGEIPCIAVPATPPVGVVLGLFLQNFKLFVPYGCLDRAEEICAAFTVADGETDSEE